MEQYAELRGIASWDVECNISGLFRLMYGRSYRRLVAGFDECFKL